MSTDVKIENRTQFLNDFQGNVPFQSDEDTENQLECMAMHDREYPNASTQIEGSGCVPGGLTVFRNYFGSV
ncbi:MULTISPECIES: hypothetical protein [Lacticaseibacillus]|uniref:hypothetical protein n=1 Tax=Lacticaseibacillus TaxID=2759736 RepID=UPI000870857D|nr:hypothetical protein [Lacticaseibacillus casei]MDZ5496636.1 hypothetical protein [Lacticaseibacillus casei]